MSIFKQLTEKPWLPEQARIDNLTSGHSFPVPQAKIALRFFLAMVTILFFMLIIAYAGRMAFEDWKPGPEPRLLWLNTALLIVSSIAMHWAVVGARRGQMNQVRNGLLAGGVFAFAFLTGQILAWRQLAMSGVFDVTNESVAFFYLITGLHALHLVGGLIAWNWTSATLGDDKDRAELTRIRLNIELCTIYWHFLLIVWLVLFALLFSGNNLSVLLAICGIT